MDSKVGGDREEGGEGEEVGTKVLEERRVEEIVVWEKVISERKGARLYHGNLTAFLRRVFFS